MGHDHGEAELCICFHVPTRKVVSFCRRERPGRASRISECFGAGTGCGWCVPWLEAIHAEIVLGGPIAEVPAQAEYLALRAEYRRRKGDRPREGG